MIHKTDSKKREFMELTLSQAIDYYLTALTLKGKSPETILWHRKKLTAFATFIRATHAETAVKGSFSLLNRRLELISERINESVNARMAIHVPPI